MKIGDREIGLGHPPYVIAEIGVNHDGEVGRALELTDAAADAGADAVKLQYFETDRLMSKAAKLAAYQKAAGETDPIEMLRRLELTLDEMALVVDRAHERGIHAIVTVFSVELVQRAQTLGWDAYKSASPDIVNGPLLNAMLDSGKPMIASTGAADLEEIWLAEHRFQGYMNDIAFLHCVSAYPTPIEHAAIAGVLALPNARMEFGGVYGYSDHTESTETGGLASQIGACILEKHLTYSTSAPGPDHRASLEPDRFAQYVHCAKNQDRFPSDLFLLLLEAVCDWRDGKVLGHPSNPAFVEQFEREFLQNPAYGKIQKIVSPLERDVREVSRQSVVAAQPIPEGTTITRDMLTIKRPGTGILAYRIDDVVGTIAQRDIDGDVPIVEDDIAALERA